MKNRWLMNLALLLLVALLVLTVRYKPGVEDNSEDTRLTTLASDQITRIRIQVPKKKEILLQKTGHTWKLQKPLPARVNQFNVDNVLRLTQAGVDTVIETVTERLNEYGLVTPLARVWLDNEEFVFGTLHPLKNLQYLSYQGQVHLISTYHFSAVTGGYDNFISTRLLEENRKPVYFKLPKQTLVLENGIWKLSPQNKDISSDQLNDFVNNWHYTQALKVSRYSGKQVKGTIKIHFSGKSDTTEAGIEKLDVGILSYKPEFILYRKDENLQYHFPEDTADRLLNISDISNENNNK